MEHKRPHKWPCVCQDCCAPFDPNVDFTGEPMVFRPDKTKPVDIGMPMAEFCRRILEIACKVTGRTEQQLRAMGLKLAEEEKPMRLHWPESEQYEREPGSDDE